MARIPMITVVGYSLFQQLMSHNTNVALQIEDNKTKQTLNITNIKKQNTKKTLIFEFFRCSFNIYNF